MEGAYEWMIRWEGRNTQRHVGPQAPLTQRGAAQLYRAVLQGREIQHYHTNDKDSCVSGYEKGKSYVKEYLTRGIKYKGYV